MKLYIGRIEEIVLTSETSCKLLLSSSAFISSDISFIKEKSDCLKLQSECELFSEEISLSSTTNGSDKRHLHWKLNANCQQNHPI